MQREYFFFFNSCDGFVPNGMGEIYPKNNWWDPRLEVAWDQAPNELRAKVFWDPN
jgi:hypothetical protein